MNTDGGFLIRQGRKILACLMGVMCALSGIACAQPAHRASTADAGSLLRRDNLVAWEVNYLIDGKPQGPEARAQLLKRLGFKRYAFLQDATHPVRHVVNVDTEIEALKRNGIELYAWYFKLDGDSAADDPAVKASLEAFKRHAVRPQIWVSQSFYYEPKTKEALENAYPKVSGHIASLPEAEQEQWFQARNRIDADLAHFPKTLKEQEERLERESARISALAKLAGAYGLTVQLYNHKGWFGIMDNQLALIDRLKTQGVNNVGIVYNFWHARDALHDDTKHFPEVWEKIKSHVSAVNITGVRGELETLFPSQGDHELAMLRTIQESGWNGPVGVLVAWHYQDAPGALKNILTGCDWLAAELERPGSGGQRPRLQ